MADEVKAKEERFRLRLGAGPVSVRAVVGDGNPGSLRLSIGDTLILEAPEITPHFLGAADTLRDKVLHLEGLIRKDRPGADNASLWLWVTVGDAEPKVFSTALEVDDNALVSLALNLRFL